MILFLDWRGPLKAEIYIEKGTLDFFASVDPNEHWKDKKSILRGFIQTTLLCLSMYFVSEYVIALYLSFLLPTEFLLIYELLLVIS